MAIKKKWFTKKRVQSYLRDITIVLLIVLFLVIAFSKRTIIKVKSGELGVLYDIVHGTRTEETFGEGVHVINPLNTMYIYNIRVQKITIEQVVLSHNGLRIDVNYSVLFRPNFDSVAVLHQRLGPDYANTVVTPAAKSWTRKLIADLTPDEIFLLDKGVGDGQENETDSLSHLLHEKDIILEGYLISSIHLPDSISKSIERKYSEQQMSLQYDYKLAIEAKEMKRKEIEAEGIKRFRDISNVSPEIWRALDATQQIGTAPNSKVIIMGNSSSQLPVLLNDKLFQNK